MISVYVWNYRGKGVAWGHASMLVDRTYISYWPQKENRVRSKWHSDIYCALPVDQRSFDDDKRAETGDPDHTITIDGLDEPKIIAWWTSIAPSAVGRAGPPLPWCTLDFNCSVVVAKGLQLGGGDKYASWSSSSNLVWTPNDVKEYAESIVGGIREQNAATMCLLPTP